MGTNGNRSNYFNGISFRDLLLKVKEKTMDSNSGACLYGYNPYGTDVFGQQLKKLLPNIYEVAYFM
jgi:hypothetical protein